MTKDEILGDHYGIKPRYSEKYINKLHGAMDEWAKQEAIEFAEWIVVNYKNIHIPEEGIFYWSGGFNTPELYDLFIQSKTGK